MVSNIHKVAEEIKPNLADSIAHVLTHKAMLTFIYFLNISSSLQSVSPNACLKLGTCESAMSFLRILPAFLSMRACQQSTSWPRS